eukprot:1341542-Amphidinium_carterae.1
MVQVSGHIGLRLWLLPHEIPPAAKLDVTIPTQMRSPHSTLIALRYKDLPLMLPECSLPRCQQRTNLQQQSDVPTCGLVLGGFTQRGHGVTQATLSRSTVLAAVHRVARSRPAMLRMPYLAAALTRGPVSIHTDHNYGISLTIALGEFRGGALVINEKAFENLGQWVAFDAEEAHYVSALQSGSRT